MKIFSVRYTGALEIIRKRAPKNHMYRVGSIVFTNQIAIASNLYLITRKVPFDKTSLSHLDDIVGAFETSNLVNFEITDIDEITKYITIGQTASVAVAVVITVYGDIIKATKIELIIEWFRRGR